MKRVMFVSAAFLAAGASAQDLRVSILVSVDGATWSGAVEAMPGSRVQVGIWMSGDAAIYGMGGATLRLTGNSLLAGDTVEFAAGTDTGRVGPFNFGAATNAIFHDAADTFRIDAASDAANSGTTAGLTFFQRDPATAVPGTFSTANPALCFRFDFTLGADPTFRSIALELDQLSRGLASYYTAANASHPSTATAILKGAVIRNIPGPGSAALGVMLGMTAGRRRRR